MNGVRSMGKLVKVILFLTLLLLIHNLVSIIWYICFFDVTLPAFMKIILFLIILLISFHMSEWLYDHLKRIKLVEKVVIVTIGLFMLMLGSLMVRPLIEVPPIPIVEVGNTNIPVVKEAYCWERECVEYINNDLDTFMKEHKPIVVSPREGIKIRFKLGRNAEALELVQQMEEGHRKAIMVENSFFRAPVETGIYVYHLSTIWKLGRGDYTFAVEVK